jgi:hypothetical protein
MIRNLAIALLTLGLIASSIRAEETTTVRGKVKTLHESPKGDVDGITLVDGTHIRFPPHVGKLIRQAIQVGDEVTVEGEKHVTPKGDEHVRAERITNAKSGRSIDVDQPPPPKRPKSDAPRKTEPEADKKPRPEAGKGPERHEPPHEQILAEIRAIKALVGGDRSTKSEASAPQREGPHHEQILAELRSLREQLERKGPSK